MALAAPIDELDAELERGLGGADEVGLVEAEPAIELLDGRDGRFADTDGADLFRFHQLDREAVPERIAQPGRRHPSRRAAADDQDRADRIECRRRLNFPHYSLAPANNR